VSKYLPLFLLVLVLCVSVITAGCGGAGAAADGSSQSNDSSSQSNNNSAKTLTSIAVNPPKVTLNIGAKQQLTVMGSYSDGTQADTTSAATWTTSNGGVATVNAGLLSAVAPGGATITASVGSGQGVVSNSAAVTVNAPPVVLDSISLSLTSVILNAGTTQPVKVTANFSDGSQANDTNSATWTTTNASVATVTAGVLNAIGPGTATLTATVGGYSATLQVTVNAVQKTTGANVPTWHYDNARSGLNANESTLTPGNVNANSFGKLFSYLVDGYLYAQPLYVSDLTISGAVHNVVFAATENDSVYAFDADQYGTGAPLWQVSLLQAGETPQPDSTGDIQPTLGVTSTPVIDLTSNTMYVASAQKNSSGSFFRLHALDLTTGAEKFGGPVTVTASVPGTNSDAVNGVVSLTTSCVQRAALLLADNTVFLGFGGCHSGWLLSYNAQTLAQVGVFNMSPNISGYGTYGGAGGVWMGGGGPVADGNGNIYVTTGNGPYDTTQGSYGDSVLRFNAQLQLLDHFTPYDYAFLWCKDSDLAAGGLLLIPGTPYALAGGKKGRLYLVNTLNLGGMQANDAGAAQTLWFEQDLSPAYSATCTDNTGDILTDQITGYQIYGTAAFFNGSAYLGVTPSVTSTPGPLRQFTYSNGQLTPGTYTADSIAPGSYGTTPFVSSNGTGNGIVWMLDHGEPIQNSSAAAPTAAVLRAYDASNIATELYDSAQNAADAAGYGIKFTSPIVANGKVYMGTAHDTLSVTNPQGELDVYGLK
jgi:hypothetical protein